MSLAASASARQGPRGRYHAGPRVCVPRLGREDLLDLLRLLREAVVQAVSTSGDQVGLAAAARHVRRHPGLLIDGVGNAFAIDVTEHGAAEGAAGPVVAGQVEVAGERFTVQVR